MVSQIETAGRAGRPSDASEEALMETYNPWTVVNLVFHQLAREGLHPVLGSTGDPGRPAAELLRALGIEPLAEGDTKVRDRTREQLAELRRTMLDEP
jgi:hypothetical protein